MYEILKGKKIEKTDGSIFKIERILVGKYDGEQHYIFSGHKLDDNNKKTDETSEIELSYRSICSLLFNGTLLSCCESDGIKSIKSIKIL